MDWGSTITEDVDELRFPPFVRENKLGGSVEHGSLPRASEYGFREMNRSRDR